MKYSPYSFSKISAYNSCARKFKYQYIDKIKRDKLPSDALIKGKTLHYILENLNISEEDYIDTMKENINNYPEIKEIINNFINSDLSKKYLNEIDNQAFNEIKIGITKDLQPSDYNNDNLFNGIVDYVCVKNKTLYVCDFKSGKYKYRNYQDFNQLLFYAIYFFLKYKNINKIIISYIYIEHNLENSLELRRDELQDYLKKFLLNVQKIESDEMFNKTESKLCDYCDFVDICL